MNELVDSDENSQVTEQQRFKSFLGYAITVTEIKKLSREELHAR
jgi:hypothetical protein